MTLRYFGTCPLGLLLVFLFLFQPDRALAQSANDTCLDCHDDAGMVSERGHWTVYGDAVRAELRYYFNLQLRDTSKARIINQAQDNQYRRGARNHRAQVDIYRWLSRASGHRGTDA